MNEISGTLIELGIVLIGLAVLARLANRLGLSAIPLYLIAGLAFGNGGILPLRFSEGFVHIGSEIGVLLLLFMLGLEYTGEELVAQLRKGLPAGITDLILNFPPGFIAGLLLGWNPIAALLLGGVTLVSSSGIIAKVLAELGRLNNPETPLILSILVLEDLAMAVFLPLVAVLLVGQGLAQGVVSISIALATAGVILWVAVHYGEKLSDLVSHPADEIVLLTTLGIVLLVAGIAQQFQVSAAIGAFLVGIAVSGPIVKQAHRLLSPLRDLFAAVFFLFFALQIDPASLPPVLLFAVGLGLVTALTKIATALWVTRESGFDPMIRLRVGTTLAARGEFSIIIAGLGVSAGLEPQLGTLAAAYVLFLAILGPLMARKV